MQKIDTISSLEGRKLLHQIFRDLRFNRQLASLKILYMLWKLACFEVDVKKYTGQDFVIRHRLGMRRGSILWLEEVVNRFFFSSFLSLVYFGAAILIFVIGISRFTTIIPTELIIASVFLEAMMLVMIFILMLFSPKDDSYFSEDEGSNEAKELLMEIGEIGRDIAAVAVNLEKLGDTMTQITKQQQRMIDEFSNIGHNLSDIASPNPEMIEQMRMTNFQLSDFSKNMGEVNNSLKEIEKEKISAAVRKELEIIIANKMGEK